MKEMSEADIKNTVAYGSGYRDGLARGRENLMGKINELEKEIKLRDEVIDAARSLLFLKEHKDEHGKDVLYKTLKPSAWICLDVALSELEE